MVGLECVSRGPLDLSRSERSFYLVMVVKRCFRSQTVCEDCELACKTLRQVVRGFVIVWCDDLPIRISVTRFVCVCVKSEAS